MFRTMAETVFAWTKQIVSFVIRQAPPWITAIDPPEYLAGKETLHIFKTLALERAALLYLLL